MWHTYCHTVMTQVLNSYALRRHIITRNFNRSWKHIVKFFFLGRLANASLSRWNDKGAISSLTASLSSTVPHKIEGATRIKKKFTQLMPYKLCLNRISHQVKYIFYDKIKDSIIICIGNTAEDRSSLFLTWANRGEFSDTSFVHINVLHMPNTQTFSHKAWPHIGDHLHQVPHTRLPPTLKSACDPGYGRAGETKFRNALSCVAFVVV